MPDDVHNPALWDYWDAKRWEWVERNWPGLLSEMEKRLKEEENGNQAKRVAVQTQSDRPVP